MSTTSGMQVGLPETGLTMIRGAFGGLALRKWEIRERGQGYVPEDGPVIIASNHTGWLDGPLMFIKVPRKVHALVKEEEFEGRTGRLLSLISQIRVARDRVDTGAMRRAASALAASQAVGIGEKGADASSRPPKGAHIDMVYGRPFRLDAQPWPRTGEMIGAAADEIHEHLLNHLTWAKDAVKRDLPGPLPGAQPAKDDDG